jgi:endonuclease I
MVERFYKTPLMSYYEGFKMILKIVLCVSFFSLSLLFPQLASAYDSSYYSQTFLDDVHSGTKDEDLRDSILSTFKKHSSIGYEKAKVFLMGNFYLVDHNGDYSVKDVYCDRERSADEFPADKTPAPNKIPANEVINTEHTWPQSRFNKGQDVGMQKADLHHLFPTDSKLNSIRGSFKFGEVQKDLNVLACPGPRIGNPSGSTERVFEPPQQHKGNVARALFYFSVKYKLTIDKNEEAALRKWNQEDPVDAEEILRNDEIEEVQHSRNPFIDFPELSQNINNF